MIIRVFRGRVHPGMQKEYERELREVAVPNFYANPGLVDLHLGLPSVDAPEEFLVVTAWEDLDSLRSFAGENWRSALLHPGEAEMLRRSFVQHFEDGGALGAPHLDGRKTGTARVLVVAGRELDGRSLTSSLGDRGLGALTVPTAAGALRVVARWIPDAAVVSSRLAHAATLIARLERAQVPVLVVDTGGRPVGADTLVVGSDPDDLAAAAAAFAGTPRPSPAVVEAGMVRLDTGARMAYIDGAPYELPPKEFSLLTELVLRPEQPIPPGELALRIWPESLWMTAEDVRRAVYRLRKLIGDHGRTPPLIRNRRGFGYVLEPDGR